MATDEELESLREKSVRASTVYDDLEADEGGSGLGAAVRRFSPRQRVILAFLLLLDVIALVLVVWVVSGLLTG